MTGRITPQVASALSALDDRPAAEDYLVAVAALAEAGGPVAGVQVARVLGVSEPSVTQMMHRLVEAGLVVARSTARPHTPGIQLTEIGEAAGAWLLERRRVCEAFFVQAIGLGWSGARAAADRMEHALTPDGVVELHRSLGSPTSCPHGNALRFDTPGSRSLPPGEGEDFHGGPGEMPVLPLRDLGVGETGVIVRLLGGIEQDAEVIAYLERERIAPGDAVIVEGTVPLDGSVAARRGRRRFVLPAPIAGQVLVLVQPRRPARGRKRSPAREPARAAKDALVPQPCRPTGALRLTAVQVDGPCESGHRAGDSFVVGKQTPRGLCSASYLALMPAAQRLLTRVAAQEQPTELGSFTRRCPGDGFVLWRLEACASSAADDTAPITPA
ncbi:MAG TPA: iron dependent repressor, metal binding and dimerization domain protein [Chloroflexota bacterium]|nr:iron dependent repressor, metal binding and dimerization domain protein [Chloroflexota bacterium]